MTTNVSAEKLHRIYTALPGTRKELAERTGVAVSTCGYALAILAQDGRIYIGAWRNGGAGRISPIYHAGHGVTPPKPKSVTPYRPRERKAPEVGTLRPRVDAMLWLTAGRQAPEVHA